MAGFLFVMDSIDSINTCIDNGEYSTRVSLPTKDAWSDAAAGTLGDYATMRSGDNVYFFAERKIYGVGSIVGSSESPFGFFQTAPNVIIPMSEDDYAKAGLIVLNANDEPYICPWVVKFSAAPLFFDDGIDMDDMLGSSPNSFRSLRCIEGRSFIKLDDKENRAFKTLFYRRNESFLGSRLSTTQKESALLPVLEADSAAFVLRHAKGATGEFQRESQLETSLLMDLAIEGTSARDVFGNWDYLSHQVHASPFKPVHYMDRMDIFGYRWIQGHEPMVSQFVVIELKKGTASKNDVLQLLRYVDWVTEQYADGDCSLVKGFLVANKISNAVAKDSAKWPRYYTRPKKQKKLVWENIRWDGMNLVTYEIKPDGSVEYTPIAS